MDNYPENKIINELGNIELRIAEDNLSAYLVVHRSAQVIDEQEIIELIEKAGIVKGIEIASQFNKDNNIQKEFGKPFLVAKIEIDPEQAEISYNFDPENCLDPDSIIDLFSINTREKALAGEIIAHVSSEKISEEKDIFDIFGHKVSANSLILIDPEKYLGNNVAYSNEKKAVIAEKNGYIYLDEENRFNIKDEIIIKENIHSKHLHLFGNVIIQNSIDDSHIRVEGNLNVKGEIKNCLHKAIVVSGNAVINIAEKAYVITQGKLVIKNKSIFSVLEADQDIIGEERSTITGGLIRSALSITLQNAGSPAGITELEITSSPFLKYQIVDLAKKLEASKTGDVSEEDILPLKKEFEQSKTKFSLELDYYLKKKEACIRIENELRPRVLSRILDQTLMIDELKKRVDILYNEGIIKIYDIDK